MKDIMMETPNNRASGLVNESLAQPHRDEEHKAEPIVPKMLKLTQEPILKSGNPDGIMQIILLHMKG